MNRKNRIENNEKNERFSNCANEIMELLDSWIVASNLTRKSFCDLLNKDFYIEYKENDAGIECKLYSEKKVIGLPFITKSVSKVDIDNYKSDLALLLLHITSLTNNANVVNYIYAFVRENLQYKER